MTRLLPRTTTSLGCCKLGFADFTCHCHAALKAFIFGDPIHDSCFVAISNFHGYLWITNNVSDSRL